MLRLTSVLFCISPGKSRYLINYVRFNCEFSSCASSVLYILQNVVIFGLDDKISENVIMAWNLST